MAPIDVVLLHYPALNRCGGVVATNVLTTDVHDIARACRTFGVRRYYVAHPEPAQRAIVHRVLARWEHAPEARLRTNRRQALSRTVVVESFNEAVDRAEEGAAGRCVTVGTSAAERPGAVTHAELRRRAETGTAPLLLVLGTGWGIARSALPAFDLELEPIRGVDDFNHLSVRSAIGIILDRLRGGR